MVNLPKLAWRNIQRNRRRTVITAAAIIVGVTMMIIVNGIVTGMLERTIANSVELETGHIKVYPKSYYEKSDLMPTNMHINSYVEVTGVIDEIEGVECTSPRIKAGGMLKIGQETVGVIINGINPESDLKIRDLKKRITEGEYLASKDSNLAMIGAVLAEKLKIGINDEILISSMAADGSEATIIPKVKAIFKTGFSSYDGSMIFLPLLETQNMLKIEHKDTTEIVIMVTDSKKVKNLNTSIESKLREGGYDYDVLHWEQLAPELAQFAEMEKSMSTLILFIVLIIATVGILNTMLMAVYERVKEIGVMAAFGYKRRNILVLFLLEGLIIGAVGALLGCILGVGINHFLSIVGINFAGGEVVEFYETCIYPKLSIYDVIYPFFFAIVVSILASLYPAYKASKLEPVEALRHV